MSKGQHRLLEFHAKLVVPILGIVLAARKILHMQSWVSQFQTVHCSHMHPQVLSCLAAHGDLEFWKMCGLQTDTKSVLNCWGSLMLLAQSYKAKVMRSVVLSVILVPTRSRLGYAEFHCTTLQETQGTNGPLNRTMDSIVCLKMTAEHDCGLHQQQKVGRTPASHSTDTTLVIKIGFSV